MKPFICTERFEYGQPCGAWLVRADGQAKTFRAATYTDAIEQARQWAPEAMKGVESWKTA